MRQIWRGWGDMWLAVRVIHAMHVTLKILIVNQP